MPALNPARLAAQQARSTETSNRLLAAAEALFAEQSFDDTSVAEIAERAGVTTGAFYARFRDKEALLEVLEEQLYAALGGEIQRLSLPHRTTGLSIEEILDDHHGR